MPDAARRRLFPWIIAIALAALASAPYLQTLRFEFVNFDDNLYVTENPIVQQGLTWLGVKWAFTTIQGGNWHPLTWLSHMLDCTMFRRSDGTQWAGGHHLVNLLLHTINTLLVWITLREMTGALWRSALVAALFAVHPLHVESVAWVAERKDVLSALFGLSAIFWYALYVRNGGVARYLALIGCFAMSLLAKPMLVTLPFVLLLLDIWPLERLGIFGCGAAPQKPSTSAGAPKSKFQNPRLKVLVLEKAPLLVLSAAFCLVAVISQHAAKTMSSLELVPLPARLINAIVAYAAYLLKLVAPVKLAV